MRRKAYHLFILQLLVLVVGVGSVALASEGLPDGTVAAAGTCHPDPVANEHAPPLHTFAVGEHDVLIDLPVSHELAGSNGRWYVFGYQDDLPLVPDVSVYFVASASMDAAIASLFPGSSKVEVERCFSDELFLVTSPDHHSNGAAISVERYVLPVEGGIIVAERYESFDWEFFDLVGERLRTYREVE